MKCAVILLLFAQVIAFDPCTPIFTQPEIEDVMKLANKEGTKDLEDCLSMLIRKGVWDMVSLLIEKAREHKVALSGALRKDVDDIIRNLDKIIGAFDTTGSRQQVTPAMKWAQSPSTVLLDIKYAHRFDAPGCMDVENRTVTIESTKFSLQADCEQSGDNIHIQLEMDLFAEIDPDMSFYSDSSAGRLYVNLQKKEKAAWPLPIKGGVKPANLLVWWEMKEKHASEMTALEEELKAAKP